jgi:cytoskeletal protein RodZ
MTRNQKIALGCGVTGCLGLILIVVVVIVLAAAGILALPGLGVANSNDNSANSSSNANDNSSSNQNTNSSSSTSRSTMSEDDKHKLMQAAGMTKDSALMQRVLRKLGFVTDTGISDDYPKFIKDHVTWASKNYEFIRSVNTPGAARAYVEAHIDD